MNKLKSSLTSSSTIYKKLVNHKLFNKKIKFGLKNIKLALKLLGNPEKKLNNVINILGESGKFTTLWTLKNFIEANNQTVSCFISPSLQNIRERFYLENRYLTNKEIKDSIKKIDMVLTNFMNDWGPEVQKKRAARDDKWDEMVRVLSIQNRNDGELQ